MASSLNWVQRIAATATLGAVTSCTSLVEQKRKDLLVIGDIATNESFVRTPEKKPEPLPQQVNKWQAAMDKRGFYDLSGDAIVIWFAERMPELAQPVGALIDLVEGNITPNKIEVVEMLQSYSEAVEYCKISYPKQYNQHKDKIRDIYEKAAEKVIEQSSGEKKEPNNSAEPENKNSAFKLRVAPAAGRG